MCQPAPRAEGSPCRILPIGAAASRRPSKPGKGFGIPGSASRSGPEGNFGEVLAEGSVLRPRMPSAVRRNVWGIAGRHVVPLTLIDD